MSCAACEDRALRGRPGNDPIHCGTCHQSWTGNEAQHCTRCHHTFSSISPADAHRYRKLPDGRSEDRCIEPALTEGWREMRAGVWTNSAEWAGPAS